MLVFILNDPATTEIYTLSHTTLFRSDFAEMNAPLRGVFGRVPAAQQVMVGVGGVGEDADQDRKSTRLNSSHSSISYAVFCLKKKKVADVMSRFEAEVRSPAGRREHQE